MHVKGAMTATCMCISITDPDLLSFPTRRSSDLVITAGGNLVVSGTTTGALSTTTSTNGTTSFGATTVGTNLTTSSDGAVSQTGALVVNGTGSITTTADAIDRTSTRLNSIRELTPSGAACLITDMNALTLGTLAT